MIGNEDAMKLSARQVRTLASELEHCGADDMVESEDALEVILRKLVSRKERALRKRA